VIRAFTLILRRSALGIRSPPVLSLAREFESQPWLAREECGSMTSGRLVTFRARKWPRAEEINRMHEYPSTRLHMTTPPPKSSHQHIYACMYVCTWRRRTALLAYMSGPVRAVWSARRQPGKKCSAPRDQVRIWSGRMLTKNQKHDRCVGSLDLAHV